MSKTYGRTRRQYLRFGTSAVVLGRCPATGKLRHVSYRHAKDVIRAMERDGDEGLSIYRCVHCDAWHVGHHYLRRRA